MMNKSNKRDESFIKKMKPHTIYKMQQRVGWQLPNESNINTRVLQREILQHSLHTVESSNQE